MVEEMDSPKKMSMTNTKQELVQAYNTLLRQLQQKREVELKPEKKIEEKKASEVIKTAESVSSEGVVKDISDLKIEMGKMLALLSDRLEDEVNKFKNIQKAIELKEQELQELYGIEKAAATLAALIEAQNQKRGEFEVEMAAKKEALNEEIEETQAAWDKEKKEHAAEIKERDVEEKKTRERGREEFGYTFKREQQLAKDKFEDEKARVEKELQVKREELEKELKERERVVAEKEKELEGLQIRVNAFPKEMDAAVDKVIKETTERLSLAAKNREELLKKEFDGERNVLMTRIESLEKMVKEQSGQITKLSQQSEGAYQKMQDIAIKAIEGASSNKILADLQQLIKEQRMKQAQEK